MANYCADCAHATPPARPAAPWRCDLWISGLEPDLVTGVTPPPRQLTCHRHRYGSVVDGCGTEGRFWTPRPPRSDPEPVKQAAERELETV